ncbi:microtubule-actin cross-linking factor 1, isoforms 6/7-like [Latimeria chalumnae]|uniref:microtubule-actin cross-linking factor 1, isoforms 6/7-like n=1 Tax=Latimeria chalumnae TaxID=7897 RepID=UPI00313EFAEF
MGKPLSRPDCLRQTPNCLGKGEEEDGYIEDCYVPQRSIYDTMRINEQIDQGTKLSQPSKSTIDKTVDGSTLSSNGTLGASNVFESRPPDSKKLDERVIFDALKLSSDILKSAPAPARRRPQGERKENINRRSWKAFMPPNFPEFAERLETASAEPPEAAFLTVFQDKRQSVHSPEEGLCPSHPDEPMSNVSTLEHGSKSSDAAHAQEAEGQVGGNFKGATCFDECLQNESSHLLEEIVPYDYPYIAEEERLLQTPTTWPRVLRCVAKEAPDDGHHKAAEMAQDGCLTETAHLTPCLSEDFLVSESDILIAPNLRVKTESELIFEEDERRILMEAEDEWVEELQTERREETEMDVEVEDCYLASTLEQEALLALTEVLDCETRNADEATDPADSQEQEGHVENYSKLELHDCYFYSSVPESKTDGSVLDQEAVCDTGEAKVEYEEREFIPGLDCDSSPDFQDQCSDTDSVQMFLELEKQCITEEGEAELLAQDELQTQALETESERLALDGVSETLATEGSTQTVSVETKKQSPAFKISMVDTAAVSDLEDIDATYYAQLVTLVSSTEVESEIEDASIRSHKKEEGEHPDLNEAAVEPSVAEQLILPEDPSTVPQLQASELGIESSDEKATLIDCEPSAGPNTKERYPTETPVFNESSIFETSNFESLASCSEGSELDSEEDLPVLSSYVENEGFHEDEAKESSCYAFHSDQMFVDISQELDSTHCTVLSEIKGAADEKQVDPVPKETFDFSSTSEGMDFLDLDVSELVSEHDITGAEGKGGSESNLLPADEVVESFDGYFYSEITSPNIDASEQVSEEEEVTSLKYKGKTEDLQVALDQEKPFEQYLNSEGTDYNDDLKRGTKLVAFSWDATERTDAEETPDGLHVESDFLEPQVLELLFKLDPEEIIPSTINRSEFSMKNYFHEASADELDEIASNREEFPIATEGLVPDNE